MTTHYQKIQALGNRMASNLETMGVSASFNDGGLTLADKILQIQHFTSGLKVYADKSIAQSEDTVNVSALLMEDGKAVSGERVIFEGVDSEFTLNTNMNIATDYMIVLNTISISFGSSSNVQLRIIYANGSWMWQIDSGSWTTMGINIIFIEDHAVKYYDTDNVLQTVPDYSAYLMSGSSGGPTVYPMSMIGVTNSSGVASVSYTCTGAGLLEVTAKSGSIQSEPYPVIDGQFFDAGILNDPRNNDTYYTVNCQYERQSDGTLITPTTSNNGYLMIDETGDTKPFNTDLCYECDIVSSDHSSNGFFIVGTTNKSFNIPVTTTGYHIKIEVKTTGISVTIDEGTPTDYPTITGNYDIRFIINKSGTVKFKNAVLYPI